MGWIKPTVSVAIGALLGYYLGDLLGSSLQSYVWDFIGTFVKYSIIILAVLIGIYSGFGIVSDNKYERHEVFDLLGTIMGAVLGFYLGKLTGVYLGEWATSYVWDFIGVIIEFFVIILGITIGVVLGLMLSQSLIAKFKYLIIEERGTGNNRHFAILLDINAAIDKEYTKIKLILELFEEINGKERWIQTRKSEYHSRGTHNFHKIKTLTKPYNGTTNEYIYIKDLDLDFLLGDEYKAIKFKYTIINQETNRVIKTMIDNQVILSEISDHNNKSMILKVSAKKAGFFTIKIDGNIESLNTYKNAKQIIKITDTTDDDKVIVYTNTSPFDTSNLIGELECIPRENLNLVQGKRKLQFKYTIVDNTSGETIKTLFTTKTYATHVTILKNTQKKPFKEIKQIITSDELMIQTAFYLSNIDGNIDELEGKTITTLGKKLLEKKNSKDQYAKNKDKINTYIKNAQKDVKNNRVNIDKVLIEINKKCTPDEKNFLFETCLYIAAADGVTDKSELDFVNYLVRKMDLNKPKSKSLIEKILPTNEDNKKKEDKEFVKSLGITSSMSNQDILEILKKEYRKWNQRVGLSDSSKREQAESMLHKISELRKKYRN